MLRSEPNELSKSDVSEMILKYNFFDKEINPQGKRFSHKYKKKKISGDKVIFDKVTGLMWQQGGSSKGMGFEEAKQWIKELNQKGYAGYYDWRLPTLEEAMSLMEPEKNKYDLYIDPVLVEMIEGSTQRFIWTADRDIEQLRAWGANYQNGYCANPWCKGSYLLIRAVRPM